MDRTLSHPASQSVEEAMSQFFTTHGLDRGGYRAEKLVVVLGPLKIPFPNPGFLPFHDLHHLALNVPPRFWGEFEVSILELRSGCPTLFIWTLCMAALLLGGLVAPLRLIRTWRRYAGCRNVYRGYEYAELMKLDVGELRARMGLPASPVTMV